MWKYLTTASLIFAGLDVSALPLDGGLRPVPKGIKWSPCQLEFPADLKAGITVPIDCSTLEVPLDYTNHNLKQNLQLQLIKINATKTPFKGSIIFNPGGPGSSGVEEVAVKGPLYRDIFGGHFDVVGFDARGTGRTIPFACNLTQRTPEPTGGLSRRASNYSSLPEVDTWKLLTTKAFKDATIFADACASSQKENGRFLSTTFVARDMLRIVDALNEDGLLRFWGRSYSTVLGQTFAAMFPNRIDRMLLDSVVEADDYWSGYWIKSVSETDKALMNFFKECVNAGPTVCPLANFTGPTTSPQSLMNELSKAFQELVDKPIYLPESYAAPAYWQPGGMLLSTEIKFLLFARLYYPEQYPIAFQIINGTLHRDWSLWTTPTPPSKPTPKWNAGTNAFHGIACADSEFRSHSPENMYSLLRAQGSNSMFADSFPPQVWACAQWKIEAAERFNGSFRGINTSYPILFVNSPFDPITPLSSAFFASTGFTNSRVIEHRGHGHGAMNHPSACTTKAIGDYFANGTLPEHGTMCKPDMTAWEYAIDYWNKVSNATVQARSLRGETRDDKIQNMYNQAMMAFSSYFLNDSERL